MSISYLIFHVSGKCSVPNYPELTGNRNISLRSLRREQRSYQCLPRDLPHSGPHLYRIPYERNPKTPPYILSHFTSDRPPKCHHCKMTGILCAGTSHTPVFFLLYKRYSARCFPIRKHRGAREKRYSFGYAVFLILALMKLLWIFPGLQCPYSRCQFPGYGSCPSDRWQHGQQSSR